MTTPPVTNPPPAPVSLWQRFKGKDISYLTLPLLIMATIVEFVILATGVRYQRAVCVPQGMGVTFFGIGPIGATMLAVELLKLPLAIWTASRKGWLKAFMIVVGLPMICILTFQLVKDMAVYEMSVATKPASILRDKAMSEELRMSRLNDELANQTKDGNSVQAFIDAQKAERDRKLAELAAKQQKAKTEIEDSLKRNEATRTDAITLTDFQKEDLDKVESRQTKLIQQFKADTDALNKEIADLHTRRETEVSRSTFWNAEEARINNAYGLKLADYTNRKNTYEKDKAVYDKASFLERQVLKTPIDPGVPPVREENKLLKPTLLAEIESQLKAKEAELVSVNNKRRDSVAQIESDAHRLREDFDRRSGSKREEADHKREELLASITALTKESAAEARSIDAEYNLAVAKEQASLNGRRPLDTIRGELDEARKNAEGYYDERVEALKNTQVHRIATTVEIIRGLLFGERPISAKATSKERGDIFSNQIDMVRIWVYPVLAFIVAFLPTLMVEVGVSTLFKEERKQPQYRVGFLGRGLHRLYTRAGRRKILQAERLALEASSELSGRDRTIAETKRESAAALAVKESELRAVKDVLSVETTRHADELKVKDAALREELQRKEESWGSRLAQMSESLNKAILEKDELRDLQTSEVERQIQQRQSAWLERITQLRQELDDQRNAAETERKKLMEEQHEKLKAVTEESKSQVLQIRRQASDAELASVEKTAKLSHDLKEALLARQTTEAQLKNQAQAASLRLTQAKEDAARDLEMAAREETHRTERLQLDFANTLRQREDDFAHRLQQQEQELNLAFDAKFIEERNKIEQEARRREGELERRLDARARDVDARWTQQVRQIEEAAETRLKQREQQLQSQASLFSGEKQAQLELESRRQEAEFKRQLDAKVREAEGQLREALQQQEMAFIAKTKQTEQELLAAAEAREEEWNRQAELRVRAVEARQTQDAQQKEESFAQKLRLREQQLLTQAEAREAEAQTRHAADLRTREEESSRQVDARVRAIEARLTQEAQQKEEAFNQKLRQREQQLAVQAEAREAEAQTRHAAELRTREEELARQVDSRVRAVEARLTLEAQQKEDALNQKLRQREQQLTAQAEARDAESQTRHAGELRTREEELGRQSEARLRAVEARLIQDAQQKDEAFAQKLRQREQQLATQSEAREAEAQTRFAADLRTREEELNRQADSRARALESRLTQEAQQKEEALNQKLRQSLAQSEARETEAQARHAADLRTREEELARQADSRLRAAEVRLTQEAQQKEEAFNQKLRQREQQLAAQTEARLAEAQAQVAQEVRRHEQEAVRLKQREQELTAQVGALAEIHKVAERKWESELQSVRSNAEAQLARTEKERDEARKTASDGVRQVQSLEEKLLEFSTLFASWKGGLNK